MAQHVFDIDRRRVFPHHKDMFSYHPDPRILDETVEEEEQKQTASGVAALEAYGPLNQRAQPNTLYHRSLNSFNDPLSVYFVLDTIVNSMRGVYLRPWYVVAELQRVAPQIHWTPGVVGRIMKGFEALCFALYIEDQLLEDDQYIIVPDADGMNEEEIERQMRLRLPFAMGRDAKGRFYIVDPEGGNEGLLWLMQARKIWLKLAREDMRSEGEGDFQTNWGNVQTSVEWFMEVLTEPVRPARAYRNQLGGGATFKTPTPQEYALDWKANHGS